MKIDDPKVKAFISGELSFQEEEALRKELQNFPEVADIAETMKATAKRIRQDKVSGEKPFGLTLEPGTEILTSPSKKRHDAEIPVHPLGRFFYEFMGPGWKAGLLLLSAAFIALIVLFVFVPLLQGERVASKAEGQFKNALKKLEAEKKLDSLGAEIQEGRSARTKGEIATHGKSRSEIQNNELVKSNSLGKSGLFLETTPPTNSLDEVQILSSLQNNPKKRFKTLEVNGLVNRLVMNHEKGGSQKLMEELQWEIKPAPWKSGDMYLVVKISGRGKTQEVSAKQGFTPVLSKLWDHPWWQKVPKNSGPVLKEVKAKSDLISNWQLVSGRKGWLLLSHGSLSEDEAEYMVSKWREPGTVISTAKNLSPGEKILRSKILSSQGGIFLQPQSFEEFRRSLNVATGEVQIAYSQSEVSLSSKDNEIQVVNLSPSQQGEWLGVGESRYYGFLVRNPSSLSGEKLMSLLDVRWSRQRISENSKQIFSPEKMGEVEGLRLNSVDSSRALVVTWLGLMLKGELPLNKASLSQVKSYTQEQNIVLDDNIQKLFSSLVAIY